MLCASLSLTNFSSRLQPLAHITYDCISLSLLKNRMSAWATRVAHITFLAHLDRFALLFDRQIIPVTDHVSIFITFQNRHSAGYQPPYLATWSAKNGTNHSADELGKLFKLISLVSKKDIPSVLT